MRFKLAFKLLKPFEIWLLIFFFIIFILSGSIYGIRLWNKFSIPAPARGGEVREGVTGEPRFLNPLFSLLNDADQDAVEFIYDGLYEYNNKAELVPSLASGIETENEGKTVILNLRSDIFWHDGEKLSPADVIFTIETIKNPKTRSPLRSLWQDVKVFQSDGGKIKFEFNEPQGNFLEKLTLKILPEHIWKDVLPENILSVDIKTHLIGTGPYKFIALKNDDQGRITNLDLEINRRYHKNGPFINKVIFYFYKNENELLDAYSKNIIDSFGGVFSENVDFEKIGSANIRFLKMPRYYAVFLNPNESKVLNIKEIREALELAIDKTALSRKVFNGKAEAINSVIPENFFKDAQTPKADFDAEKANQILEKAGWKLNEKTKIREKKLGKDKELTVLSFRLMTSDWPPLRETARFLEEFWKKIGAKIEIQNFPDAQIQKDFIKPRKYDALIFGEVLGTIPDFYNFWHSSERKDPGLNLSFYVSKEADKILEELRKIIDNDLRIKKLNELAQIINKDKPAIFLFSPDYVYVQRKNILGFETEKIVVPSKRFSDIENWHLKTKRVLKK
ncbi:MAG: peptide ABC transporter substrate-binding protein [Parcubacteria group bacterium]|nr:peptide ABC transporter substrate-binding protein [Parcubacteria group bacterium]